MTTKRGRPPVADAMRRQIRVACRLTEEERDRLDALRGGMSRGEWLRTAALASAPPVIPPVNRAVRAEIGQIAQGVRYLIDQVKTDQPIDPRMLPWLEKVAEGLPALQLRLLRGEK